MVDQVLAPGEVAGDYSADWRKTFDLAFLIGWMITVAVLGIVTFLIEPEFFRDYRFIAFGDLALIIILIIGIGDGLAEPVGIYLGKHQYKVPAWFSSRSYFRSIEGSACVFLSSIAIISLFHRDFHNMRELIAALLIVPVTMTIVEATAPHSMDTPALMLLGFSALYAVLVFV